eukprot:2837-Pyramimonas_sp.AAC.1
MNCGTFKNRGSRSRLPPTPLRSSRFRLPPASLRNNAPALEFFQFHSGMALPLGTSQDQNP